MINSKTRSSFQSIQNFQRRTERVSSLLKPRKNKDPFDFGIDQPTDKRLFDEDYLLKTQCTSLYAGPLEIPQQCYVCGICNPRKDHFICKHCYYNCHEQCREADIRANTNLTPHKNVKFIRATFKYSLIGGLLGGNNNSNNHYKEFACYCGIRLKHKPNKSAKKELIACSMMQLDDALEVDYFFCETHQQLICCVCSVYCHKGCNIIKFNEKNKTKKLPEHVTINTSSRVCQCEGDKHTSFNEIALTFPLQEYQRLSGVSVCPIQILNILFSNKNTFNKLATLFTDIINNKETNEEMKEQFYPLLELFSNTFNRKFKTFYYHDDILDMFPFHNFIYFLNNVPTNDSASILLKFRLVFILLFIHLKKDFQMLKTLTSVDFMSNTILERLIYKKMLTQKTIFTININKKYGVDSLYSDGGILKNIAMEGICPLMEIGMDYVCIEENQDEFEIGIKYLCFMLKHMFFTKNDLIKLIYCLYRFHSKFYEYINSDNSNIYSLLDIFSGLSELFFIITISYNDIVVEDYLDSHRNYTNKKFHLEDINEFIHTKSDHGSLLFKMVLKSCDILKKHYNLIQKVENDTKTEKEIKQEKLILMEKRKLQSKIEARTTGVKVKLPDNGGLFYEKIIKIFNETLKMFALADNVYLKQLNSITKDDIIEYYSFVSKIHKNEVNSFLLERKIKVPGLGHVISESETNLNSNLKFKEKHDELEALYTLKITIESTLSDLFTFGYGDKNKKLSSKIFNAVLKFSDTMKEIFNSLKPKAPLRKMHSTFHYTTTISHSNDYDNNINKKKPIRHSYTRKNIKEPQQIYIYSEAKQQKYVKFIKNIKDNISGYFSFLNNSVFNSEKEYFVDCLILSNIDETLSKLLVFFCMKKYPNLLTIELLDAILSFCTLFFLTKRGMNYFVMGKNISRLNKIFKRFLIKNDSKVEYKYSYIILNFMKNFFKGILHYELSLKEHKVLPRLKRNILSHISHFSILSKDEMNYNEFKEHFILVMKIFYYLSDDFEFEDLEEIKRKIILICMECPLNLLQPNTFKTYFENYVIHKTISIEPSKTVELMDENKEEEISSNKEELQQEQQQGQQGKEGKIVTTKQNDSSLIFFEQIPNNFFNEEAKGSSTENNENENMEISVKLQKDDVSNNINKIKEKNNELNNSQINIISGNSKSHETESFCTSSQNHKINISLYSSLFNLVSKNTFYIFKNESDERLLSSLYDFVSIDDFKPILSDPSSSHLKLKLRIIILKYSRTMYLLDKLDHYNILHQNHQLTTEEFITLTKAKAISLDNEGFENSDFLIEQPQQKEINNNLNIKQLQTKMKITSSINSVIHLYIQELSIFPNQLLTSTYDKIEQYYIELLYGIKHIADFIYLENEIWSKIILSFYKLVHEFLNKVDIIIYSYHEFSKLGIVTLTSKKLSKEMKHEIKKIQLTSFNIYNKSELYKCINEALNLILNETNLNQNKSLSKYLEIFDIMAEANFTPFSLIETLDYEYFYEENSQNTTKPEPTQAIISKIRECFITSFINISNTNFLDVISTISNESVVIDYRKKIVDYFHSFLNSIEGNSSSKMESLLCIITKMLFYDGDEMQRRFEHLIDNKFFFSNFNVILNQNIILTISLSRNIFAFERALRITNLTKLVVQFLQSLGEGFNTTYHNNIFTCSYKNKKTKVKQKMKRKNILSKKSMNDNISETSRDDEEDDDEDTNKINTNKDALLNTESNFRYETKRKEDKIKAAIISIPQVTIKNSIYESVIYNLKRVYHFLNMDYSIDAELPYDKLIILSTNLIDFLIEYIQTTNDKESIINSNLIKLFFGEKKKTNVDVPSDYYSSIDLKPVISILTLKLKTNKEHETNKISSNNNNKNLLTNHYDSDEDQYIPIPKEYLFRKKIICYIKMKFLQLLISYLQTGNKDKFVNKLLNHKCGPLELYQEILYFFYELLQRFKAKKVFLYNELISIKNDDAYVECLINYYTFEKDFRETIELPLCLKLYILIKTYEDMYSQCAVRDHFIKLKRDHRFDEDDKLNPNSNEIEDMLNIRSNFSKRVYMFLEKIVLKVEIKKEDEDDEDNKTEEEQSEDESNSDIENNSNITKSENDNNSNIKKKVTLNKKTERIVNKVIKQMVKNSNLSNIPTITCSKQKIITEDIELSQNENNATAPQLLINEDTNSINKSNSHSRSETNSIFSDDSTKTKLNSLISESIYSNVSNESSDEEDLISASNSKKKKQPTANQITFFVRPFITFTLSEHSKHKFEQTVTRTNATSKFVELVSYSDYCLFEMVVNYHTRGKSKFLQSMADINFFYVELINYLFIILQNILIMNHFYKSPNLEPNEYEIIDKSNKKKLFKDNLILTTIQSAYLFISIFIWYYFKFANSYQLNLMKKYNRNFIFRKKGDKHSLSQKIIAFFKDISNDEEEGNNKNNVNDNPTPDESDGAVKVINVLSEINKDVSTLSVLYVALIETMLLNREMNILLLTFILNIIYFCTRSCLCLAIPVLFIANLVATLFDIFISIKMKYTNMLTVLLFSYLIIYIFSGVAYYYMSDVFTIPDILDKNSESTQTEGFCFSSIQCFLFILSQGVRAGGGIGDIIAKVSFQSDPGFFVFRFFYDMLFFILIILVLGNVFLGIIVDTFAELRDQNTLIENDKRNICFICQLSRDACLTRNIDFNRHVKSEHFIWNYVYFLIYLHVNNANDFNSIENSVWNRLQEQDYGWFPMGDNEK